MSYFRRLSRSRPTAVAIVASAATATLAASITALVVRPAAPWPSRLTAAVSARPLADSPWSAPWEAVAGPPSAFVAEALDALARTVGQVGAISLIIAALSLILHAISRVLAEWRPLAVRCALGAPLRRLLALVGGELLLLGAIGGGAGLAAGGLVVGAVRGAWPAVLERPGYAGPAATLAAIVAGVVAALLGAVAVGLLAPLQRGGVRTVADLHGDHVTAPRTLLGVQNALAAVQLAGLLAVTYALALILGEAPRAEASLPYPDSLVVVPTRLEGPEVEQPATRAATYAALLRDLDRAGVQAAVSSPDAWLGFGKQLPVFALAPSPFFKQVPFATVRAVATSPGALGFMGLVGPRRDLTPADTLGAPRVAVLSRAARSRLVAPVARTGFRPDDEYRVVGVAHDITPGGLGASGGPLLMMYVSLLQHPPVAAETTLRVEDIPALRAIAAARAATNAPRVVLGKPVLLADRLREFAAPLDWFAGIIGVLAIAATLVGILGLSAVMAQVVTLRRRDIAVRLAIGALPRHIEGWLVGKALRLTVAGAAVGVSVARWVGWLMRDEAHRADAGDLGLLAALILAFAPLGIASCWLPGRRAARVEPAEVWARPHT